MIRIVVPAFLLLGLSVSINAQDDPNPFLTKDEHGAMTLTREGASHFARIALDCIQREYPNKLGQVLQSDSMLLPPRILHPAFHGCFDWHSAVHGHWMLVRLMKLFPDLPETRPIIHKLNENLSPENILGEVDYFNSAGSSFERMYGWSWFLKLAEELATWDNDKAREWYANLEPLTEVIVQRYLDFLPKQDYPIRTGVHPNTAFGLSFAFDFAVTAGRQDLGELIEERALDYFSKDRYYAARWEPSGEDFLSAALEEAGLMARILPYYTFNEWFGDFLWEDDLEHLLTPANVSDRSDPKIVHLDGLNLSRAWNFYRIAPLLQNDNRKEKMLASASAHLKATLPFVASEHYEGSHWLASFAVYALSVQ